MTDTYEQAPAVEAQDSTEAGPARTARMIASILLDYPGENYAEQLDVIRFELDKVEPGVADELQSYIDWASGVEVREVEDLYVSTFDQRRKCSLYLTYYSSGDTRMRGAAIVSFKQAFESVGWTVSAGELPDYLPAVLELSARTGDEVAEQLINVHRDGLEVLRSALENLQSPWASVVRAVIATLPPLSAEAEAAYKKLITDGPPAELVGIQDLPFPVSTDKES